MLLQFHRAADRSCCARRPRESDLVTRSKNRAMVGTYVATRPSFSITHNGNTKGLVEHRPRKVLPPPRPEPEGRELSFADISEARLK